MSRENEGFSRSMIHESGLLSEQGIRVEGGGFRFGNRAYQHAHDSLMAHDGPHIVPRSVLFKVFGALIVLTIITVAVAYVPLGMFAAPVAVAIAVAKASLVVMFFMHLKYDNPVNALTFTIGTIFVVVFISVTLLDTAFRGDLGNVDARTVQQVQAEQEEAQQRQEATPPESLRIAPSDYSDQRGASLPAEGGS